jgi:hypothetical protein
MKTKNQKKNISLKDQAVKKLKETVLELERFMRILDAMANFGTKVIGYTGSTNNAANLYFDGLYKMRNAVYEVMCRKLADCFMFSAISEEIRDIALESLKKQFGTDENGTKNCVIQFLEDWGNLPYSWKTKDEEAFREEISKEIAKAKKTQDNQQPEEKTTHSSQL